MKTFASKVELFANIAIVIVALLIGGVLAKRNFFDNQSQAKSETSIIGSKISLPEVDWEKNQKTLLLVLSKDCRYCTESLPFYQQLAKEALARGNVKLIAVFPQSVVESKHYLNEAGIAIDDIRQATPATFGVRGTPTLILADSEGAAKKSWMGKLSPDKEGEILSQL